MTKSITILGIETSCDETSVAVMRDGKLHSNIVSSQFVHGQYGGVVPELASRAHQKLMIPIVEEACAKANVVFAELSAVAGVRGPGLMGSLLVGLNFGKSFAYGLGIPFIGVNHMEAHIYSNFIDEPYPAFPLVCLTVSGGHTQLVSMREDLSFELIGETRDDAAGEAFDKVAKLLGLGYPGGPKIDAHAKQGNPAAIDFPRSYLEGDAFGFSFSGIKTSVLYYMRDNHPNGISQQQLDDICASFQASVVDVLVNKTLLASNELGVKNIALAGGVSANSRLRSEMSRAALEAGLQLCIPKSEYCTDNAAMIAALGYRKYLRNSYSPLSETAVASLELAAHL